TEFAEKGVVTRSQFVGQGGGRGDHPDSGGSAAAQANEMSQDLAMSSLVFGPPDGDQIAVMRLGWVFLGCHRNMSQSRMFDGVERIITYPGGLKTRVFPPRCMRIRLRLLLPFRTTYRMINYEYSTLPT